MIRIQLPDTPGSLGSVATAMGTANADISAIEIVEKGACLLYTSPSPRDLSTSRMPSSA